MCDPSQREPGSEVLGRLEGIAATDGPWRGAWRTSSSRTLWRRCPTGV